MDKEKLTKEELSKWKKEQVNKVLNYEYYAWYTAYYYRELQEEGSLNIVDMIMFAEGVDEDEAIGRCIGLLATVQLLRADLVQLCKDLVAADPSLNDLLTPKIKE